MNIDRPLGGTLIIRTIGKTMTRSVAVLALLLAAQPTKAQTTLPSDVAPSCTVPAADFKRWFATGNPTKDGIVLPAGSLTFTPDSACSFYKWSQQMFLWLTSPVGGVGMYSPRRSFLVSKRPLWTVPANSSRRKITRC